MKSTILIYLALIPTISIAQFINGDKDEILTTDSSKRVPKVLHAEPLYVDLIRDLGARKGEQEWNVGLGITDNLDFDSYQALVEYEFAPLNHFGLEIELPFTFYSAEEGVPEDSVPSDQLQSIKLAAQWSFFVSEELSTSMALGYINEFELSDFRNFGNPFFKGNTFNPFFVAAKRWGSSFHTLLYTGPKFEYEYNTEKWSNSFELNASFHYMIPSTRNFIGIELISSFEHNDFDLTIRPEMRLGIAENILIGIVGGIPVQRENQRLSSFIRLIWEPIHHIHY
jgi:hypothetical protein